MRARRIALTVAAYLVIASVVLGTARTVASMLVLPPLFLTLLAGAAVLGLPLAVVLAWRYEPPARDARAPPGARQGGRGA